MGLADIGSCHQMTVYGPPRDHRHVERAVAQLIEVHGGAFPAWLAPVQLVVLPISAAEEPAAAEVRRRAVELGLRVEIAHADEGSLGARIRENRLVPFQAVIGAREAADDLVAIRLRSGQRLDPTPVAAALDRVHLAAAPSAGGRLSDAR